MIDWQPIETAPKCEPPQGEETYDDDERRGPTILLLVRTDSRHQKDMICTAWWAYPYGYGYPREGRWMSLFTETMGSETNLRGEPTHWAPFPELPSAPT